MDQHSLEMLEFPRVREILASLTSFSASRELALGLMPSSDLEVITGLLKHSREARRVLALKPDFSIGYASDVREAARMASKGSSLEPLVLLDIGRTLASARVARSGIEKLKAEVPTLWSIASKITPIPDLESEINRCISPDGEVMDSASEKLANLRRRLRAARQELVERLEAITRSRRGQRLLQEPIVTERDGRFVIPVKSELRTQVKGIVHDVSNTGATVFIEPWATVDLGNELRELIAQEKYEVERIMAELSAMVGENERAVSTSVTYLAELDLALAKARYAQRLKATEASITFPQPEKPESKWNVLRLVNARHPLLKGKPVPMSVEIGKDFSTLVITGPNTGGKTVALKTIGLLTMMTQAGLPIPAAEESSIPVFDSVFADIGDEQSIERTLSTFSWHIGNINRIIGESTASSLVLLDELGTSTDPLEGVALAQAILLHFLSRGTIVVATTHFSDLKVFAHTTQGVENASLAFDPVTLSPTYYLTVGTPGGSNALAIAARLGLPREIIENARGVMARGPQQVEVMLTDLASEKEKAEKLTKSLTDQRAAAETMRRRLQEDLARIHEEERTLLRETRDGLLQEAADLQRQLREAEAELKKSRSKDSVEHARKSLAELHQRLEGEAWRTKAGKTAPAEALSVGDKVRLINTNLDGTIVRVLNEGRQVEVQAGQTRITLGIDGVEKIPPLAAKLPDSVSVKPRFTSRAMSFELDLRGKRADDVYPALDGYLNDAFMANLSQVRIIHGFATGTVRSVVREILGQHPLVKSFRPGTREEGGDGVTMVSL
ncbi:MAG: endonuclease MutS2 [Chloroflexota bacterium]